MAKDKMNIPQIRFKRFEGEWNNRIIDGVIQLRNEVENQVHKCSYATLGLVRGVIPLTPIKIY